MRKFKFPERLSLASLRMSGALSFEPRIDPRLKYATGGLSWESPPANSSTAQTELLDQRLIARVILALEIIKQAAALGDESEQTTAGMVILLVVLEMIGQVLDALGKDGHLDFRRPGIALGGCEFSHQFLLALGGNRHRVFPYLFEETGRPQPGCRPAGAGASKASVRDAAAHIVQFPGKHQPNSQAGFAAAFAREMKTLKLR
ncbi:hypothetical protein MESS2_1030087 [Mesorhizobium metallidurans STM 2683]|uniref:Uncharacterized protein n=1 Tax=Mesorhizobium metallidurans STM 2683 TaxID=1297569 RepID=M5EG32_9HYPH|nr:hypothetical protein MESS2_1030087 [Mesorhizobium metallidurans STM 2683]